MHIFASLDDLHKSHCQERRKGKKDRKREKKKERRKEERKVEGREEERKERRKEMDINVQGPALSKGSFPFIFVAPVSNAVSGR
jgi:hypothetical protein